MRTGYEGARAHEGLDEDGRGGGGAGMLTGWRENEAVGFDGTLVHAKLLVMIYKLTHAFLSH